MIFKLSDWLRVLPEGFIVEGMLGQLIIMNNTSKLSQRSLANLSWPIIGSYTFLVASRAKRLSHWGLKASRLNLNVFCFP